MEGARQAGIARPVGVAGARCQAMLVVAPVAAGKRGERWAASLDRTRALLDEVGVELVEV